MNQQQNLITKHFIMKYASQKFFKSIIFLSFPLMTIICGLMVIQFLLGGKVETLPPPDDTTSMVEPSEPITTGPDISYTPPEEPTVMTTPIYELIGLAPSEVCIVSIDNYDPVNPGISGKTLMFAKQTNEVPIVISGYASSEEAILSYISAIQSFNKNGSFSVRDDGRTQIEGTVSTMFKLTVLWEVPA